MISRWDQSEGIPFQQIDVYEGATFFDHFTFFTGPDPTNGHVYYASEQEAFDWGYVKNSNPVYIGCDSWSVSTGSGRGSVRITSTAQWTASPSASYLFVLDLAHMPQGCGTWPAWWFVGPDWPNSGEIDVIEGVNAMTQDQTTLHTAEGCTMNAGAEPITGTWVSENCWINAPGQSSNQGCSILGSYASYGQPFNQQGGGVYALSWNISFISVWFFPRNNIPYELSSNSSQVNTDAWGVPVALFPLGSNCPFKMFQNLQMVFDLTFCGDWAGNTFPQDCPNLGSCQSFVQNNPTSFQQAFWSVNSIKIFQS